MDYCLSYCCSADFYDLIPCGSDSVRIHPNLNVDWKICLKYFLGLFDSTELVVEEEVLLEVVHAFLDIRNGVRMVVGTCHAKDSLEVVRILVEEHIEGILEVELRVGDIHKEMDSKLANQEVLDWRVELLFLVEEEDLLDIRIPGVGNLCIPGEGTEEHHLGEEVLLEEHRKLVEH